MNRYLTTPTTFEMARMGQANYDAFQAGGISAAMDLQSQHLYNIGAKTSIVATTALFPSSLTQIRLLPLLLRGGMSTRGFLVTYGGNLSPFPGLGMIAMSELLRQINESRGGRDAKPGTTVPPVGPGRRPRPPVKPSRSVKAGQTSKPFWANGKPKCKKGFRYDFKRKLCVKIK